MADRVIEHLSVNFNGATLKVKAVNCIGSSGDRNKNISKKNACRITSSQYLTNESTTQNLERWILYPNPTSGKTQISFNSNVDTKYNIEVTDLVGKIVRVESIRVNLVYNSKEIDLSEFKAGVYFISMQTENDRTQTFKVVKEE